MTHLLNRYGRVLLLVVIAYVRQTFYVTFSTSVHGYVAVLCSLFMFMVYDIHKLKVAQFVFRAQEIFKQALHASELRLRVVGKNPTPSLPGKPPPDTVMPVRRLSSSDAPDSARTEGVKSLSGTYMYVHIFILFLKIV